MLREAVYHRPKGNYAYPLDHDTLQFRIRTKRNDVDSVYLIWDDPFRGEVVDHVWSWIPKQIEEMNKCGSTELYDYWTVSIRPRDKRVKYSFELRDSKEVLYFTEKGFYPSLDEAISSFFLYPYLLEEDVFAAPDWVKDTIWYQIFPERFANGDKGNDIQGTLPWGSEEPSEHTFFGGDFQGVINHLDYLDELGITGIYFTPIFKAPSNHKYDTEDYLTIDPQFGDKETFKRLVNECHKRGIKVMLDAVFNHCGFTFPPFQDVLENGENSRFKDWFHIDDFPLQTTPVPTYMTFGYTHTMPKLNTANEEVRSYLLEVGRYWVKEFDIDGWRLDVANEVSHDFWRGFRKEVKKVKPDLYILGEIWHDALPWLQGDQFDAVMNYPYTSPALDFFAKGSITAIQFANQTTDAYLMYPKPVMDASFNLLGSHDTPRIATLCGNDSRKVRALFTFLLTSPGTPCFYYGDEIGMTGAMDPGCRKCMEWDTEKQDRELLTFITELIDLRKKHRALSSEASIEFIQSPIEEDVIGYKRSCGDETVLCFLSRSDSSKSLTMPDDLIGKTVEDLLTGENPLTVASKMEVEAFSIKILRIVDDSKRRNN
ncbi:glycoside hydrolase family 13 protein [Rossellomorea sp. y25]|uniref:glycoside hydrolase family 13 protein n=1 Tax=Rossellomorea sp. y25 TaxID=3118174 RepID=UPI00260EFAEC|nr:glycoside hydrolase family 13 protein [uncultured Rossellomorea sp.]